MNGICTRPHCTTCRAIVVGLIAEQLRMVPTNDRARLALDALQASERSVEAMLVEQMIG